MKHLHVPAMYLAIELSSNSNMLNVEQIVIGDQKIMKRFALKTLWKAIS